MASANFLSLTDSLARGNVNFATDSFKGLLVSALPDETALDTWEDRADVTGEISGTGYTAGGVALTLTVGSVDTTNNRIPITITDLAPGWTSATLSAVGLIIYKTTGVAANDKLVSVVDFGGTVSCTAGNFSVDFTAPLYINR